MRESLARSLGQLSGPILITGHTGFKGTWLTLLLESLDVNVVGYSLAPKPDSLFSRMNRTATVNERFADIRDRHQFNDFVKTVKPSAIIHMAAQPFVLDSYRIPLETFEINLMGSANILDVAFANESVKVVIVVTTDKVYRNENFGKAFTESDPLSGKDPYSASKVAAEAAVSAWQQIASVHGGPKIISVRAGNVIGGGDWGANRLFPDLVRNISMGKKFIVRNSSSTRPWQHVLDPLIGYLYTLEAAIKGTECKSINFGPSTESFPVSRVVELAAKHWPHRTIIEFEQNNTNPTLEATSLHLNSDFARKTLGWEPFWSQEAAVVSTMEWWDKVLNKAVSAQKACQEDIKLVTDMDELAT